MDALVGIALILLVGTLIFVTYFLPFIIADCRKVKASGSIFVLNLLLGWTTIFWFVALFWALTGERRQPPS